MPLPNREDLYRSDHQLRLSIESAGICAACKCSMPSTLDCKSSANLDTFSRCIKFRKKPLCLLPFPWVERMAEAGRCNPINLEEEELTQFKASLSMIMLFRHEAQRDTY